VFVSAPSPTIIAFLDAFGSRTIRHEPFAAFRALRERLPDMEPRDIAIAADLTRAVSSEMRALAHRVFRELETEQRKNAAR
jgi:hypothetical protein